MNKMELDTEYKVKKRTDNIIYTIEITYDCGMIFTNNKFAVRLADDDLVSYHYFPTFEKAIRHIKYTYENIKI